MKPQHVVTEEYGDHVYRKERHDYITPGLGAAFFIFGLFSLIGGIRMGEFGSAMKIGIFLILIGLGIFYFNHRKQKRLDKYVKRRKKHGAAIHDSYWN